MTKLMTHKESNYRAAESTTKRCGTCTMFRDSNQPSCTLVQRPIRAHCTCDYWAAKRGTSKIGGSHAVHQ